MDNYEIGGQERKIEVNEGIANIPENQTLLIQLLTDEPPLSPEVIHGIKNIQELFAFFNPTKEISMETESGTTVTEKLRFGVLSDFGKQGIIKQSAYLKQLNTRNQDLLKFTQQLKTNKVLRSLLENKEAKAAYLSCIQNLIDEMESSN
jgi:hypothetical protein